MADKRAIQFNEPIQGKPSVSLVYDAEPTARRFHNSNARVRLIKGPEGSGKSSACVVELFLRAMRQIPYQGVRHSRFAVIRNTYPALTTTTLPTFLDWIKEQDVTSRGYRFTLTRSKPMEGRLWMLLPDQTEVDCEIVFLALDGPEDIEKLQSFELTGAYCNEAQFLNKAIFIKVLDRIGRYPSKRNGGFDWTGVWADANPPSTDSWIYEMFEVVKPPGWEIFHQPPALLEVPKVNPGDPTRWVENRGQDPRYSPAENIRWLGEGFQYYFAKTYGRTKDHIRVYVQGFYGNVASGKVVYSEFASEEHIATEDIAPMRGLPLAIGFDYGLSPAAAIAQLTPRGGLVFIDEIVCGLSEKELEDRKDKSRYFGDTGIRNFATNILKPYLANRYGGMEVIYTGDPAGTQRSQTDELTVIDEFARCGITVTQARTNKFIARKEAVEAFMMRRGGLKISPRCAMLIEGFQKHYKYRMVKKPDGEGYTTEPEKNIWSHIHDAAQYVTLYLEDGGRGNGQPITGMGDSRNQRREVSISTWGGYV